VRAIALVGVLEGAGAGVLEREHVELTRDARTALPGGSADGANAVAVPPDPSGMASWL